MIVMELKHENGGTFFLKGSGFVSSLMMADHYFSKSHAKTALRKVRKFITVSAYENAKPVAY